MQVKVKNIAKVTEADMMLEGVTVISGYNNMGKSTILKAMYITLSTFRNANHKVAEVRKRSITSYFLNTESYFDEKGFDRLPRELLTTIAKKVNENLSYFMNSSIEEYRRFKRLFYESLELYKDF